MKARHTSQNEVLCDRSCCTFSTCLQGNGKSKSRVL